MVAVPRLIQEHLDLREGGTVYWHTGSPYEGVLARSAHRVGGRPAGKALETEHQKALETIARLKQRLGGRDQAVLHEGKSVGWAEAQKYYSKIAADLGVILTRLDRVEQQLAKCAAAASPAPGSDGAQA
jgi:hypothetical protein